jgi:hypothetical protein
LTITDFALFRADTNTEVLGQTLQGLGATEDDPFDKVFLQTKTTLLAGAYYLQVIVNVMNLSAETARYDGSLSLRFAPGTGTGETPLPGALVLMGSVLFGATGYSGLRNRRSQVAATA